MDVKINQECMLCTISFVYVYEIPLILNTVWLVLLHYKGRPTRWWSVNVSLYLSPGKSKQKCSELWIKSPFYRTGQVPRLLVNETERESQSSSGSFTEHSSTEP